VLTLVFPLVAVFLDGAVREFLDDSEGIAIDPDLYQYEPLAESRTKAGRECLSNRTGSRPLPSMTSPSNISTLNSGKTLVIYNYFETARAKRNVEFFMEHGFFLRPTRCGRICSQVHSE